MSIGGLFVPTGLFGGGGRNWGSLFTDMGEPTGFVNQTDSDISFVNGTRTFTIEPAVDSFTYYIAGNVHVKSASEDVVIADTEGMHYIYYDDDTLSETTTFTISLITEYALVATIYWDATNSEQIYFGDERHGITMDGRTHYNMHVSKGAVYVSGLALGDFSADGGGNLAIHAQFSVANGTILDEDIFTTITDGSPQDISTTLNCPVYYRDGASPVWRRQASSAYPVISFSGGSNLLAWNENNAGTWQQTEAGNGQFILAHIYAINDVNTPIIAVQGQQVYTNITAAREGAETEITTLATSGLPFAEAVAIGSVIYQTSTSYVNAVKARVRTSDTGENYVDFRLSQGISAGNPFGLPEVAELEVVSVRFAGAKGDGATDDSTAIETAITAIGSDTHTLYFGPGTYYIGSSVSVPANIEVRFDKGALIQDNGDAGVSFTINGQLDAGIYQIFNFTGAGSGVVAGTSFAPRAGYVYPEWWGAVRDGATGDSAAIQEAIDLYGRNSGSWTGGTVYLSRGTYAVDTELLVQEQGINIIGDSGAILLSSGLAATKSIIKVEDSVGVRIENLIFYGDSGTPPKAAVRFYTPASGGTNVGTNEYCTVRNCKIARINETVTATDTYPFVNGIIVDADVSPNNGNIYVEDTEIYDCSDYGFYTEYRSSDGCHLQNVLFQNCGYGVYTNSDLRLTHATFKDNTVDLFANGGTLTSYTVVSVDGFYSTLSGLPVSLDSSVDFSINGGNINLDTNLSSSVWLDSDGARSLTLNNLTVVEDGVANTYINCDNCFYFDSKVTIKNCVLPNMDDGSGISFDDVLFTNRGIYIDIDHGPFSYKGFLQYRQPVTVNLADGAGASFSRTDVALTGLSAGDLVITAPKADMQGIAFSATAHSNTTYSYCIQNETGGALNIGADVSFTWHRIDDKELLVKASTTYDMPNTADQDGETTTIYCPGAALGDFVVCGVNESNYGDMLITPYVSAPGIVSVRIQNESGGAINPGSATLTVGILRENWDYIASKLWSTGSIADHAVATTTLTVPGVKLGDFVVASIAADLDGLILSAYVSAADTVEVVALNGTGGFVILTNKFLRVMVKSSI